MSVKYTQVDAEHPEFMTKYEGIDQTVNVELSITRLYDAAYPREPGRRLEENLPYLTAAITVKVRRREPAT